jgi:hypothetical protein
LSWARLPPATRGEPTGAGARGAESGGGAEAAEDRLELLTGPMPFAHHSLVTLPHIVALASQKLALSGQGFVARPDRRQRRASLLVLLAKALVGGP